jgi:hypothetical protein
MNLDWQAADFSVEMRKKARKLLSLGLGIGQRLGRKKKLQVVTQAATNQYKKKQDLCALHEYVRVRVA